MQETHAIDYLLDLVASKRFAHMQHSINHVMQPVDLARMLQNTPTKQRNIVWGMLNKENRTAILPLLEESMASYYMQFMGTKDVADLLGTLDDDDMADLASSLPEHVLDEIMSKLSSQDKGRLERMLAWDDDAAGSIMNTDMISVSADITLDVVWRYLRYKKHIAPDTDTLFVVDADNKLIGLLPITTLLTNKPSRLVHTIMEKPEHVFSAEESVHEVAKTFEKYDLLSAPVIDAEMVPVGRITIDDVVDIIREEAERSVRRLAKLDAKESLFSPLGRSISGRALWLGINLITALIASFVIAQFTHALDTIVILAVLMPIIASMGGIATTQSFTLVVRAMAQGGVSTKHIKTLLLREFSIGISNGVLWAGILGSVVLLWFHNQDVAAVMGFALIVTLTIACIAGAALPFLLNWLHIDVALAGGVILTTITDVCGYLVFLGTATLFLL